jgi:hypothetical protein
MGATTKPPELGEPSRAFVLRPYQAEICERFVSPRPAACCRFRGAGARKTATSTVIMRHAVEAGVLGMTAPPGGGDGRGIGNALDELIEELSVSKLIARRFAKRRAAS